MICFLKKLREMRMLVACTMAQLLISETWGREYIPIDLYYYLLGAIELISFVL